MAQKTIYKVVFISGCYRSVDYETDNYEQAQEVLRELTLDMRMSGERDFCYIIERESVENDSDDEILNDRDFNSLCGR